MAPYYFNVDGDAPYDHGALREETGSLFLLEPGAWQGAPRIVSEHEADVVARNREIARLPFSWAAQPCRIVSVQARPLVGSME